MRTIHRRICLLPPRSDLGHGLIGLTAERFRLGRLDRALAQRHRVRRQRRPRVERVLFPGEGIVAQSPRAASRAAGGSRSASRRGQQQPFLAERPRAGSQRPGRLVPRRLIGRAKPTGSFRPRSKTLASAARSLLVLELASSGSTLTGSRLLAAGSARGPRRPAARGRDRCRAAWRAPGKRRRPGCRAVIDGLLGEQAAFAPQRVAVLAPVAWSAPSAAAARPDTTCPGP